MAKPRLSAPSQPGTKPNPYCENVMEFKDHDIAGMDPMKAQESFKPTESKPVRLGKQMAGDPCMGRKY